MSFKRVIKDKSGRASAKKEIPDEPTNDVEDCVEEQEGDESEEEEEQEGDEPEEEEEPEEDEEEEEDPEPVKPVKKIVSSKKQAVVETSRKPAKKIPVESIRTTKTVKKEVAKKVESKSVPAKKKKPVESDSKRIKEVSSTEFEKVKGETKETLRQEFKDALVQLKLLIDILDNVFIVQDSNNIVKKPKNPFRIRLGKYSKGLEASPPELIDDIFLNFMTIYKSKRLAIIKNKDWISTDSISIPLYPNSDKKMADYVINLSVIYNTAEKLKEATNKRISNLPKMEANDDLTYQELLYPDFIKLHMYRIFRCISPSQDHVELDKIIIANEEELGQKPADRATPMAPKESAGDALASGFADFTKNFDMSKMGSMIGNIFGNPEMQKSMTGMIQNLGDIKPGDDLGAKMGGIFKDPNLSNSITSVMKGAIDQSPATSSSSSSLSSTPAAVPSTVPVS